MQELKQESYPKHQQPNPMLLLGYGNFDVQSARTALCRTWNWYDTVNIELMVTISGGFRTKSHNPRRLLDPNPKTLANVGAVHPVNVS